MHTAIGKDNVLITGKTVEYPRESLVSFYIAWTLEKFIKHGEHNIPGRGNKSLHRDFIRKLAGN